MRRVMPLLALLMLGFAPVPVRWKKDAQTVIPCPSEWEVVNAEYGGEAVEFANLRFTYTPMTRNRLWVFAEVYGEVVIHHHWAEYELRPAAAPAEIDFRDRRGIYEFDGERLRVCLGAPDGPRPKIFGTVKGDERLLLMLKREADEAETDGSAARPSD